MPPIVDRTKFLWSAELLEEFLSFYAHIPCAAQPHHAAHGAIGQAWDNLAAALPTAGSCPKTAAFLAANKRANLTGKTLHARFDSFVDIFTDIKNAKEDVSVTYYLENPQASAHRDHEQVVDGIVETNVLASNVIPELANMCDLGKANRGDTQEFVNRRASLREQIGK